MIEQLQGIAIEIVIGDVMYNGQPVKRLEAETLEDLIAQAKAWINSRQSPEQYDATLWGLRYK